MSSVTSEISNAVIVKLGSAIEVFSLLRTRPPVSMFLDLIMSNVPV